MTSAHPTPRTDAVATLDNGDVRIPGTMRVSVLADDAFVRAELPALADACDGIAAHRHASATLADNLTERRPEDDDRFLALIRRTAHDTVHPSDVAVALTALDAQIEIAAAAGTRLVAIDRFYSPSDTERDTLLGDGESLSAVLVPKAARQGVQRYHEQVAPEGPSIATVSAAGCRRTDGEVRIVLGGVASQPWRVNSSIEEDVASGGLDQDIVETLAERALYDAEPMRENAYRMELASELLRRVIGELA